MNSIYDRLRDAIGVACCFVGLGLIRRWFALLSSVYPSVNLDAFCGVSLFNWFTFLSLAALALFSKRYGPLYQRGIIVVGGMGSLSFGVLLVILVSSQLLPNAFSILGEAAGALGFTTLFVLWMEAYGCLSPARIAIAYSASFILCSIVWIFVQNLTDQAAGVVLFCLPILSAILLISSWRKVPANHLPLKDQVQPSLRSLWRLLLWVIGLSLAFGIADSITAEGTQYISFIGRLAPNIVIFIGVVALSRHFDLALLYRLTLPLIVIGFVGLLLFSDNYAIAQLFLSAGNECFLACAYIIVCSRAYRHRLSAAYLSAVVFCLHTLGVHGGGALGTLIQQTVPLEGHLLYGFIATIGVILFFISVVVFRERDFYTQWDMRTFTREADSEKYIASIADQLGIQFSLSDREKLVVSLMAKGKTNSDIAEELFIAPGTVRTHVSRIYAKMNVHSREEFMATLGIKDREV